MEAVKLTVTDINFQKLNFYLNTEILPLAANIVFFFFSSKTFTSLTFKKMLSWYEWLKAKITDLQQEAHLQFQVI